MKTKIDLTTELEVKTGLPKEWFNEQGCIENKFKTTEELIEDESSRFMLETTGLHHTNTLVSAEVWQRIKSFPFSCDKRVKSKKDRIVIQRSSSSVYIENNNGDLIL